jgi:methionyl aminopeptidase
VIGTVPPATTELVKATREAMNAGIAAAVVGNHLADISGAIEDVARAHGYGIVRSFVGHGIGTEMHEEPQVTNYRSGARGRRIEAGLCLAIEPMFTLGTHEVRLKDDGWTVVTADGSLAAHFENTIAVTTDGPRILTEPGVTLGAPASAGPSVAANELASAGRQARLP